MMLELKGHCQKCQAPVFLSECMDWYGNTIMALHCWNGHYKWIEAQGIEEEIPVTPEINPVTHIAFFDLS